MEKYITLQEVKREVKKALENETSKKAYENNECVGIVYSKKGNSFTIIFEKDTETKVIKVTRVILYEGNSLKPETLSKDIYIVV